MIQLIIGEKGNGKTKILLDKVNTEIKQIDGSAVFIDKSKQHMYEVSNKVRLIDVTDFPIHSTDAFIGFICGILSQDRDLENIYLDSFLKVAVTSAQEANAPLKRVLEIAQKFNVNIVISISITKEQLDPDLHKYVINM